MLKRAWDNGWVTNNGILVQELETKLKTFLGLDNLLFCANGTIVLQMALKALGITREVITTPFSYVATLNAILWEGCTPVFADIGPDTFCIDAEKIEEAITENTEAILATHVYGFPCDVDAIQRIADKHQLKVIYDGAHAFGCSYKGKSLLDFGDISTCSFHATKIFHTVEGGAIICHDKALFDKIFHYRQFGHIYDEYFSIGINAKNSELHAAMGLCLLPLIQGHIDRRKMLADLYDSLLNKNRIKITDAYLRENNNYGYYPVLFESESVLLKVMDKLREHDISPRRYFYPSLNELPHVNQQSPCPVSESISRRVLALPLFNNLAEADVSHICSLINSVQD